MTCFVKNASQFKKNYKLARKRGLDVFLLEEVCEEIGMAYEMRFAEIGMEKNHVRLGGVEANTVGQYGSKDVIIKYIQNQGKDVKIHESHLEFDFGI